MFIVYTQQFIMLLGYESGPGGRGGYMHTVHEVEDVLCCDILKIPYLLYISNVLIGISCLVITLLRQYPLPGYFYI